MYRLGVLVFFPVHVSSMKPFAISSSICRRNEVLEKPYRFALASGNIKLRRPDASAHIHKYKSLAPLVSF